MAQSMKMPKTGWRLAVGFIVRNVDYIWVEIFVMGQIFVFDSFEKFVFKVFRLITKFLRHVWIHSFQKAFLS